MKKYLLAISLVLALVLAVPVATRAESLNVAQLRAIVASLQAQLNFLITKLQLQIQQQNPATPAACIPENGIRGAGSEVNNCCPGLERELLSQSGTMYKCVKPSTTSQPSITITSPQTGDKLIAGSNVNINFSSAWSYDTNCFNRLELLDTSGKVIGSLMPTKGQQTVVWNTASIPSYTCGTGNVDVKINPGTYRFRIKTISADGNNEVVIYNSGYFTITSSTPSLKATLNVTALNGAIQCFKAPCEFPLSGAQVTVYDANKALVGNQIVGSSGVATFSNLNPGTYTVYVGASGYTQTSGQTVGLVSGQSANVKIPVFLAR